MITKRTSILRPCLLRAVLLSSVLLGSLFLVVTCTSPHSDLYKRAAQDDQKYSQVRIAMTEGEEAAGLRALGLGLDHVHFEGEGANGSVIDAVLSEREMDVLSSSELSYEILVTDISSWYRERSALTVADMASLQAEMQDTYPVQGFEFGSMGGFYTLTEVVRELDAMRSLYPSLVTEKRSLGKSYEERDIWMVKISDNADTDEEEMEILYTALHHAREPQSMATLIYFMYYLLENYDTDDEVTYLVDNRELYFIPVLNPDGYVYNAQTHPDGGGLWRKNRRDNGDGTMGVDPNRNYGYQWGLDDIGSSPHGWSQVYRGNSAFSEPETEAMRDFVEDHNFIVAFNYHTYGAYLLYPWGYKENSETPDALLFQGLTTNMTQFNGYTSGTASQTLRYITNGAAEDWFYGEQATKNKIFGITPEVGGASDGFWPAPERIYPLAQENIYPNLQLARGPAAIFTASLALSATSGDGAFQLTPNVLNRAMVRQSVDIWVEMTGPNALSALVLCVSEELLPGIPFSQTTNLFIQSNPPGEYELKLSVGEYPDAPWLSETKTYHKNN